jgi:type II secretory pathway component PulF
MLVWAGLAVFWAWFSFLAAPRFRRIFGDFRVELPTATRWLLDFAGWVANGLGWVALVVFAVLVPLMIPKTRTDREPDRRPAVVWVLLLSGIVANVISILWALSGTLGPLVTLSQTVR